MEPVCEVRWYSFSWNDVLRLPVPTAVRRAEVEVLIDWDAKTLGWWEDREPQVLGLSPWSWVREDQRIAEWQLGDSFRVFRDLRIYFYVHEPGKGQPLSIHILAVKEDGEDYRKQHEEELLARREEVLALLGGL